MAAKAIMYIGGVSFDPFLVSWILTAVFFAAQLWLCFRGKRVWLKVLPAVPALAVFLLGVLLVMGVFGPGEFYGAAIGGAIFMACGSIQAAGPVLAWVVYVITLMIGHIRSTRQKQP